jgi:hypothetical protein
MTDHAGEHKLDAAVMWWGQSKEVVSEFPALQAQKQHAKREK